MSLFKVGLTRDLLTASGQRSFGSGPLDVLEKAGDVLQWEYIRESVTEITPDVASRYDAIYVNAPKVTAASVARSDCRARWVLARIRRAQHPRCDFPGAP